MVKIHLLEIIRNKREATKRLTKGIKIFLKKKKKTSNNIFFKVLIVLKYGKMLCIMFQAI